MAVDKFKDECALLDFRDSESVTTCKEMADRIWQDYLSLNSPNEVSLPSEDRDETMERMKKPGEFRGKLFDVAMQDAIKTLQKDTLLRFLKSPQYNEMSAKVTAVYDLMVKKAFEVDGSYQIEMPAKTNLTDEKIASTKEFSLDDILNDKILFSEMLEYLEKSASCGPRVVNATVTVAHSLAPLCFLLSPLQSSRPRTSSARVRSGDLKSSRSRRRQTS